MSLSDVCARVCVGEGHCFSMLRFALWLTAADATGHRSQSQALLVSRDLWEGRHIDARIAWSRDTLASLDWLGWLAASGAVHHKIIRSAVFFNIFFYAWWRKKAICEESSVWLMASLDWMRLSLWKQTNFAGRESALGSSSGRSIWRRAGPLISSLAEKERSPN